MTTPPPSNITSPNGPPLSTVGECTGRVAGRPLRIAVGGIGIESSTFCPHRSGLDDFHRTRDSELLDRYTWTQQDSDLAASVTWVPLLHARALPGGPVEAETYLTMKDELVHRIRAAGPVDGMVYDIHGAMSVVGLRDAEADLTEAVRAALNAVGTPDSPGLGSPMLSAAMDLHGNVSRRFAEPIDLLTAHRLAPHEDAWQTRERAARNLVTRLRGDGRPYRAWVQIPVLLPGEKTSTRLEPAKSIYGSLAERERQPSIVDAALWVGYAWADEPRCQAAVVVTGDDPDVALTQAGEVARDYWQAREDFRFVGPTGSARECVAQAVASEARPFLISDSGDNPTAGGAGDLAYMLRVLLEHETLASGRGSALHPGITDPDAVASCLRAGLGAHVTLDVGGTVDTGHGGPCRISGTVTALQHADATDGEHGEPAYQRGGAQAAVTTGGVTVVLTERRKPFHQLSDFLGPDEGGLGIDPREYDLVVVKIGYLEPELHAMAADWLLALTPGGVDQDLLRLGHRQVRRPLYPFDTDFEDPDLTPVLL